MPSMRTRSSARTAGPARFKDSSHARTSLWRNSYPRYRHWKSMTHSRQSDRDIKRLQELKRTFALSRRASRDATALLTYVTSGQRRGTVQGYAFIGEARFAIEGGTNFAQFTAARRLASKYADHRTSQNAEVASWKPDEHRTIIAHARPRSEAEGEPAIETIFTMLAPGFELPEAMRVPLLGIKYPGLATSEGAFVTLEEATLGAQVLAPLKEMCPETYEKGMCKGDTPEHVLILSPGEVL